MDKKSKIFFIIFGLLIAGSVAVTYWRIMIKKDYIIEAQADCDPTIDKCFIWECDPESDEEGEKCTGNTDDDIWYYEIVRRNAAYIPSCDPADEDCEALVCGENEPECEYVFCNDDNKEDQGVECNNPEEYIVENPEIEEEESCVDGEECPVEIIGEDEAVADDLDVVESGEDLITADEDAATCAADGETCDVMPPGTVEDVAGDEAVITETIN